MPLNKAIFRGTVVKGDGIASRDYDLPTANLSFREQPLIDTGVYAARATYDGTEYNSIVCYGVGEPPKFEVHLFGYEGDLYDEEIEVCLVDKVSELIPWQSRERMRQKIFHDIELVNACLEKQSKKRP